MMYDVIILGGGPAGAAAAVYAARKKLRTLLLTESFGGQSVVSADIQNWIGEKHISGFDLAKKFEDHVRAFPDMVDIKMPECAVKVETAECGADEKRNCNFQITTDKGETYEGKSLILAVGARRKKLNIPGEDQLNGKGVAYCSTCDAPLFGGKTVAVVGGGNAGLEAVVDLLPYATKIYLLEYGDTLKGDQVTQEEIRKKENVEIIFNVQSKEILGENFVTALSYIDTKTGEEKKIDVGGVFIEIGSVPNSEIVKDFVDLDKYGQVVIDSKHATTSHAGIFAAGDVTDDPYKQNNVSVGDGVKAALAAYSYLQNRAKESPAAQ